MKYILLSSTLFLSIVANAGVTVTSDTCFGFLGEAFNYIDKMVEAKALIKGDYLLESYRKKALSGFNKFKKLECTSLLSDDEIKGLNARIESVKLFNKPK